MNMLRGIFGAGVMPLLLVASGSALAFDPGVVGFGTVGYAESDQPVNYQRFIDEKGSFKRDSVLGAQVERPFLAAMGGDGAGQGRTRPIIPTRNGRPRWPGRSFLAAKR